MVLEGLGAAVVALERLDLLWPVMSITFSGSAPFSSAEVTKPARSEWPENSAGSSFAELGPRLTIVGDRPSVSRCR